MIAVDFLKISGRQEEAAQLEKAIKGYLNPKLEAKLMSIIRSFIEGK
jgi:collagenase-like PrtC family protease